MEFFPDWNILKRCSKRSKTAMHRSQIRRVDSVDSVGFVLKALAKLDCRYRSIANHIGRAARAPETGSFCITASQSLPFITHVYLGLLWIGVLSLWNFCHFCPLPDWALLVGVHPCAKTQLENGPGRYFWIICTWAHSPNPATTWLQCHSVGASGIRDDILRNLVEHDLPWGSTSSSLPVAVCILGAWRIYLSRKVFAVPKWNSVGVGKTCINI